MSFKRTLTALLITIIFTTTVIPVGSVQAASSADLMQTYSSLLTSFNKIKAAWQNLLGTVPASTLLGQTIGASTESIFTTETPTLLHNSDGASVNYELGTLFQSDTAGSISAVRFYKDSSETGTHTGRIWSANGTQLASVVFTNETTSGWQTQNLATPLSVSANTTYVVTVNTGNSYYVDTVSGLASQITNSNLHTVVGNNGVYGDVGQFPTNSYQASNYFRDIVFIASAGGGGTPTNDTTAPTTPTNLTTNGISSTQINLTWTASIDAVGVTGYKVERCTGATCTTYTQVGTPTTNSYSDTGLAANTTYRYKVRATDAAGNLSGYSTVVSGVTETVITGGTVIPIQGGTAGQAGATGWQHTGVTLQNCESYRNQYSGEYELQGPLTVDSCLFTAPVRIHGAVTLKRSKIVATGLYGIVIKDGAGPVTIEDVEITTTNLNAVGGADRMDRTISVWKGNNLPVTIKRLWTHDTLRGMDITGQNNITVEDSYLGPNVSPPTGQLPGSCVNNSEREHASAVRAAGGTHEIKFSNTVLHIGPCAWASGLIATYPENGANYNWEISGGRWVIEGDNSGAYGIAAGYTPGVEQQNHDYSIHDLQISTQYYSEGCPSGCNQNWTGTKGLGGTNFWSNIRKYNPGKSDDGQLFSDAISGTGDTTTPTVSLTAPANSATVTGNTTVSATAADNTAVSGVQFKLDGVNLGTEDTTSPYSTTWNTTASTNGTHTLTAVARDAAGNTKTATSRAVTVANETTTPPPTANTENIWGNRTATTFNSDSRPWELGMIFTPTVAGQAVGARVYGAPNESGSHTVSLWNAAGTLVAGPYPFTYSGTGWHEFTFPAPVVLTANQSYTVSVSTGSDTQGWYTTIGNDLQTGGSNNAHLTYPADAAVYSETIGSQPVKSYQSENYLRDIIFVPGTATTPLSFSDDFESGLTWTTSGNVALYSSEPKNGTKSVRLRKTGSITKTISLANKSNVTASFALGAYSLDKAAEYVIAEYYDGSAWVELARIANNSANEDKLLHDYSISLPASVNNLATFALRFRIQGSGTGDYGYVDDVVLVSQ